MLPFEDFTSDVDALTEAFELVASPDVGVQKLLERPNLLWYDILKWRQDRSGIIASNSRWVSRTYKFHADEKKIPFFTVPSSTSTNMYSIFPIAGYCTCWAFRKCRYPDKTCLHLRDVYTTFDVPKVTSPIFAVVHTDVVPGFRLISNGKPKNWASWFSRNRKSDAWFYSIKQNGIRIVITPDRRVYTRSGLRLVGLECCINEAVLNKVPETFQWPTVPLDCELCTVTDTSHHSVMLNIVHSYDPIDPLSFKIWVIDILGCFIDKWSTVGNRLSWSSKNVIDVVGKPWDFQKRYRYLLANVVESDQCEIIRQESVPTNWTDVHDMDIVLQEVLSSGSEGLVFQEKKSVYHSGREKVTKSFKVKKIPEKVK